MAMLNNLSISKRVGLGFLVVVMCMIGLTTVGVTRVETISGHLETINDLNAVKQRYAINFRGSVHDRSIAVRDGVLATSPAELQTQADLITQLTQKYTDSAGPMDDLFAVADNAGAEEREALADIQAVEQQTLPLIEQIVTARTAGDLATAQQALLEVKPLFVEWLRTINVLIDLEESMNQGLSADVRAVAASFLTLMFVVCAAPPSSPWPSPGS